MAEMVTDGFTNEHRQTAPNAPLAAFKEKQLTQ